jgi:hypothetical protein
MPAPASLLSAALAAAGRGWHVFPLRPNDKRPAFPHHTTTTCTGRDPRCRAAETHVGWEPRATTDPDRIRRAWSVAPFNIGVACGPSGLVVIDLDQPKPGKPRPAAWDIEGVRDGADVLAVLCDRAGQPYPADTHTVRTWSDGTHLFFRHPDGPPLRNTSGERGSGLGWLIDTRAHGGYVVGAGSMVQGRPYTTEDPGDPRLLPGWLTAALRPADRAPAATGRPVVVGLAGAGRRTAYLNAAVDRQITHLTGAADGTRNHALFIAAQNLGQLVAGGALDADYVETVLTAAAESIGLHHDPPAGQIGKTIASGLRAGARRPRTVAIEGRAA